MAETDAGVAGEVQPVVADLSAPAVAQKHKAAADICNSVLASVVASCIDGADIHTICRAGDDLIEESVSKIYNKKVEGEKPKKGVAFPTSISPNEICGHFSPLKEESRALKKGDLVKIDLGVHIDGFIAVAAHTVVVPGEDGTFSDEGTDEERKTITGRKADVLMAAWTAAEAAFRMVKIGRTNSEVTDVFEKAMKEYECTPLRGVLSHQMKQHVIDGSQVILSKETAEDKVEEFKFGANEVYGIDVFASTGDGKSRDTDIRCTIYKRDPEQSYKLKTQLGRKFVHEVSTRFPFLPFTLCAFEDVRMAKAGISECTRHALTIPYTVVAEKPGEYVAQFKFTVLLLPSGGKRVTGLPLGQPIKSAHSVKDEALASLLARPTKKGPASGAPVETK